MFYNHAGKETGAFTRWHTRDLSGAPLIPINAATIAVAILLAKAV
jgi:hypothetical protein